MRDAGELLFSIGLKTKDTELKELRSGGDQLMFPPQKMHGKSGFVFWHT